MRSGGRVLALCRRELQSDCEAANESERQKCDHASSDEASTIISSQFRHLSLHRVRQNSEK